MIKNLLSAFFLSVTALQAGTVVVPKEEPIVSFTFPDKWKVEKEDDSVEALAPDEEVFISIEAREAKDIAEAVSEMLVGLKELGVELDKSTEQKGEASVNGLTVVNRRWMGKLKEQKTKVSLSIFSGENKEKVVMMLFWGTPDGEEKNAKDLQSIVESIKAAK